MRERSADHPTLLNEEAYIAICVGDMERLRQIVPTMRARLDPSDPNNRAASTYNLYQGLLHRSRGELDAAFACFQAWHDILQWQGRRVFVGYALIEMIKARLEQGRVAEAAAYAEAFPEGFRDYSDGGPAIALVTGAVRRRQGRLREAAALLEGALEHFIQSHQVAEVVTALCERATVALLLGEDKAPWYALLREHAGGLEIYPEGDLGQELRALQALDPEAVFVDFLTRGAEA